jgi:hypothetical protein
VTGDVFKIRGFHLAIAVSTEGLETGTDVDGASFLGVTGLDATAVDKEGGAVVTKDGEDT